MPGNEKAAIDAIIKQEDIRQKALIEQNMPLYGTVLADDFMIVLTSGHIQDKAGLLGYLNTDFDCIGVEWKNVKVRIYGDTGVLTGDMYNTMRGRANGDIAINPHRITQVWRKTASTWLLTVMQGTRFVAPTA